MRVFIKNMVCPRCVEAVKAAAIGCGLVPNDVQLGYCDLPDNSDAEQMSRFSELLRANGFEILMDAEARLVQAVKDNLVKLVYGSEPLIINISDYLQTQTNHSYSTLRKVFSAVEGRSIENYFISLRIERVKELIRYEELTLSQIADMLGYSSVAHLSNQFKKVTGLSATEFKAGGSVNRKNLDEV